MAATKSTKKVPKVRTVIRPKKRSEIPAINATAEQIAAVIGDEVEHHKLTFRSWIVVAPEKSTRRAVKKLLKNEGADLPEDVAYCVIDDENGSAITSVTFRSARSKAVVDKIFAKFGKDTTILCRRTSEGTSRKGGISKECVDMALKGGSILVDVDNERFAIPPNAIYFEGRGTDRLFEAKVETEPTPPTSPEEQPDENEEDLNQGSSSDETPEE